MRTAGAHGAYTHVSESASKIGAKLVLDLERLSDLQPPLPGNVGEVLAKARDTIDRAQGHGASEALQRITVNIGVMQAGLKVNMIPSECLIEADLRLPVGVEKAEVLAAVDDIVSAYPQVTYEEINYSAPSWCDPEHEMVGILQANAKALNGTEPQAICSLGVRMRACSAILACQLTSTARSQRVWARAMNTCRSRIFSILFEPMSCRPTTISPTLNWQKGDHDDSQPTPLAQWRPVCCGVQL